MAEKKEFRPLSERTIRQLHRYAEYNDEHEQKPYRTPAFRDAAQQKMIDALEVRGWIECQPHDEGYMTFDGKFKWPLLITVTSEGRWAVQRFLDADHV